jgi:hypothetical protein
MLLLTTFARFVIYVFGMTLVGVIFGSALTNSSNSWDSIGKVPGTVTELFYVYPNIYARTSDDALYACDKRQKLCSAIDLNAVPSDSLDETYCSKPKVDVSQAPGNVVASTATKSCGADGYVESQIVALADGSIWVRYTSWNGFSMIFQFVCIAAGGFVGLVIGLYMFWRSRRHETQEKAKR